MVAARNRSIRSIRARSRTATATAIGDLRGIARRLDYLAGSASTRSGSRRSIPSPMADFGYDVADYCGIDPLFGTLADFDALIAEAHSRGLQADPRFRAEPHAPTSIPGSSKAARRATARSATGISGATRRRMAARRTTGSANFGGSAWEWDDADRPVLSTIPSCTSSPTSTGAIPTCATAMLRRAALLARPRRRRLSRRRAVAADQRRPVPRQSAEPGWHAAAQRSHDSLLPLYTADRPEVHEIVAEMRAVLDGYPASAC